MGCGCLERVLRPEVFWVAPPQILSDVEIAGGPEALEIAGYLNRPTRWGEEVDRQRDPTTPDGGRLHEPEDFLNPHRQHRCLGIRIVDGKAGSRGHLHQGGGQSIQKGPYLPTRPMDEGLLQVDPPQAAQTPSIRRLRQEPVLQGGQQGFIRKGWHGIRVKVVEKCQPRPHGQGLRRPWEGLHAHRPNPLGQCAEDCFWIRVWQPPSLQFDSTDSGHPSGLDPPAFLRPGNRRLL